MSYNIRIYDESGKEVDLMSIAPSDLVASLNNIGVGILPIRRRLPTTRDSITHKFDIGGHEGYVTVGLYEDGKPGEVFIKMAKEGSTLGGLMDALGISISLNLQYGVPLKELVRKFVHTRFEPHGYTTNEQIKEASSIVDYLAKWLALEFLNEEERKEVGAEVIGGLENKLVETTT